MFVYNQFEGNRLRHVLDTYRSYFNEHRPHQGIDNRVPDEYNRKQSLEKNRRYLSFMYKAVVKKEFLGGLLKSYRRVA